MHRFVLALIAVISMSFSLAAHAGQKWVEFHKGRAGTHYFHPQSVQKRYGNGGLIVEIEMFVNAPIEAPFYHHNGEFQSMKTTYWLHCEYPVVKSIERELYQHAFLRGRRGPADRPSNGKKWGKIKNGSPMDKLRETLCKNYL